MTSADDIKTWLHEGMPSADIAVSGDGRHFDARIVDDAFRGMLPIARHRHVYAVLGDKMTDSVIHALSLKTYTRQEFDKNNGGHHDSNQ